MVGSIEGREQDAWQRAVKSHDSGKKSCEHGERKEIFYVNSPSESATLSCPRLREQI
jgi:hypothetical protein